MVGVAAQEIPGHDGVGAHVGHQPRQLQRLLVGAPDVGVRERELPDLAADDARHLVGVALALHDDLTHRLVAEQRGHFAARGPGEHHPVAAREVVEHGPEHAHLVVGVRKAG